MRNRLLVSTWLIKVLNKKYLPLTTTDAIRASVVVVVGGGDGGDGGESRGETNKRDAVDVEFKFRSSLKRLHKKTAKLE